MLTLNDGGKYYGSVIFSVLRTVVVVSLLFVAPAQSFLHHSFIIPVVLSRCRELHSSTPFSLLSKAELPLAAMASYNIHIINRFSRTGKDQDYAFFSEAPRLYNNPGFSPVYSNVFQATTLSKDETWTIGMTKNFYACKAQASENTYEC